MHSPQCPPLVWTALVVPAPQQGEQIVVVANAVEQEVGWFDTSNALAYSGLKARFKLVEAGGGAKPVYLYSNTATSLSVVVPWTQVRVFVTELSGLDGYAWVAQLQKLEAQ